MNRSLTRLESALLIAAPIVMLAGGLLVVRYDDQDWAGVLAGMAAHPVRSDVGWLLMLLGAALAIPPTIALARLVQADRPKLAAVGAVTTTIGWASVPAYCMGAIMMNAMAQAPDRAAQVQVLTDFNSGRGNVVFLMSAIGSVGYIVLAVGLARSHSVRTASAVLIGLGGASTFLVMPGPIRALLLLATTLLLAGQIGSVVSLHTADRKTQPLTEPATR
jgi:hypothetical protein